MRGFIVGALAIVVGAFAALTFQPQVSQATWSSIRIHVYPGIDYSQTAYDTCGWHFSCVSPSYERGLDFDSGANDHVYFRTFSLTPDAPPFPALRAYAIFNSFTPDVYNTCTATSVTLFDAITGAAESRFYNIHTNRTVANNSVEYIYGQNWSQGGWLQNAQIGEQTLDACNSTGTHDHMWFDGLQPGVFNIFPRDWWNGPGGCSSDGRSPHSWKPSGFEFACYDAVPLYGNPGMLLPRNGTDWAYYTEW